MEDRLKKYLDNISKIKIQQKLDSIYYKELKKENSEMSRVAKVEEDLMDRLPNLRRVFEDEEIITLDSKDVRGLIEYQKNKMDEFNEMENVAYYTGAKDFYEMLKKFETL